MQQVGTLDMAWVVLESIEKRRLGEGRARIRCMTLGHEMLLLHQ